jgi:hypothetical protein
MPTNHTDILTSLNPTCECHTNCLTSLLFRRQMKTHAPKTAAMAAKADTDAITAVTLLLTPALPGTSCGSAHAKVQVQKFSPD